MWKSIVEGVVVGLLVVVLTFVIKKIAEKHKEIVKPIEFEDSFSLDNCKKDKNGNDVLGVRHNDNLYFCDFTAGTSFSNRCNYNLTIQECNFVIDDYDSYEYQRIDLLLDVYQNKMIVYAINNGSVPCENVDIILHTKDYTEQEMELLLGNDFTKMKTISKIKIGEIIKIGEYKISFPNVISDHFMKGRIPLCGEISIQKQKIEKNYYLGFLIYNSGALEHVISQGAPPYYEKYSVLLDGKMVIPYILSVPISRILESNGNKELRITLYSKHSCTIQFHYELKIASTIYKNSSCTAKICVPTYDTENRYFYKLRKWLRSKDYPAQIMCFDKNILYAYQIEKNLSK